MSLGKIGTTLGKEIIAWTRTGSNGLLATRPVKANTVELKLAPKLESDVVQLSKTINKKPGTVLNIKTGKVEPITIEEAYINRSDALEAINIEGKTIGRMSYKFPEEFGYLYPPDKPSLYLDYIGTHGDYKGIGTELVRKLVQTSKDLGFDGRVRLTPMTGSIPLQFQLPGFYNKCEKSSAAIQYKKMGFKAYNEEIDKLLEQELALGGKGFTFKANGEIAGDKFTYPMYLPENMIQKYLNI